MLPRGAAFELRPSPGKGWGAFATRDIEPGTTIIKEEPLLSIPRDVEISNVSLQSAAAALSPMQRAQLALLRIDSDPNRIPTLETAMKLNSFALNAKKGSDATGLFPLASRFNHSCRPNLILDTKLKDFVGVIFAAFAPIAAGTELTFKYEGFLEGLTRSERNSELSLLTGQCSCDLCTAGPHERYISDMRRRFIRALYYLIFGYDVIEVWSRDKVPEVSIDDLIPDAKLRIAA